VRWRTSPIGEAAGLSIRQMGSSPLQPAILILTEALFDPSVSASLSRQGPFMGRTEKCAKVRFAPETGLACEWAALLAWTARVRWFSSGVDSVPEVRPRGDFRQDGQLRNGLFSVAGPPYASRLGSL
jgi:hypothetical protein